MQLIGKNDPPSIVIALMAVLCFVIPILVVWSVICVRKG
jgi:hypothetical protein